MHVVGGGLYNVNADALIVNVAWIGNQGDFGAAVRNIDSSPTMVNALFVGNIAEYAAARSTIPTANLTSTTVR